MRVSGLGQIERAACGLPSMTAGGVTSSIRSASTWLGLGLGLGLGVGLGSG